MTKSITLIILLSIAHHVLVAPTIDYHVVSTLKKKQTTTVLVSMRESTNYVLNNLRLQTFATREDRLNGVANRLKEFATKSQKNVIDLLNKEQPGKPFSATVLWISNQLIINDADMDLLEKLSTLNEITAIEAEKFIQLEDPIDLKVVDDLGVADEDEVQWGVQQIEAPVVWKQGNRGQGITIATIDSGARGTHEALKNNFAGDYGWFDPFQHSIVPNDLNGHGTHTTANIAGNVRNVGVAPGVKWAACRGCGVSGCSAIALLSCGQWVACPTKADGTDPKCEKAPHLVSNSWGGDSENSWFSSVVNAWHAAGIIPVFSIGNSGPSCGSAISPGDYDNVIGVGSTTIDDELSYFSSVGPTRNGARIKPDIAAPGSNVFSAYHTSDTAYAFMSGTSMASPHAAGVVALLLQENSKLNYNEVLASLNGGAVPTVSANKTCANIPDYKYPNHHVGSGRINAVSTIAAMRKFQVKHS